MRVQVQDEFVQPGTENNKGRTREERRLKGSREEEEADHNHVHPLLVAVAAAGTGQDGSYDEAIHHSKHGCSCLHTILHF